MPNKEPGKFERKKDAITMDDIEEQGKNILDKILGDISKTSATKQLIIGASTGWLTGYLAMKVGKTAAFAVGTGIILLEVANQRGYIKINWDKVTKQIDKVSDRVEEQITGEGPNWVNKMERFVDKKMDKAEDLLKEQQKRTKRWYSSLFGGSDGKLREIHIFLVSFVAGTAIGIATG